MYHWIEDKDFLKRMKTECPNVVNRLVQSINNDDYLQVDMHMVGREKITNPNLFDFLYQLIDFIFLYICLFGY